jgi:hypothetical protein
VYSAVDATAYPIITTVTLITKSWSRRRMLVPARSCAVQAGDRFRPVHYSMAASARRSSARIPTKPNYRRVWRERWRLQMSRNMLCVSMITLECNLARPSRCFRRPWSVARLRDSGSGLTSGPSATTTWAISWGDTRHRQRAEVADLDVLDRIER